MIPNTFENELNSTFLCGVVEGFYGRPWTTEQRKRLFERMNKMGMNVYLYAPKDDYKHRMYWRDLYSVEEADHLSGLIEAAQEQNVQFIYALSPGLDMTYSSSKEVTCLKRKLEQVASFGCKYFALLFDDIEVDMCETDKEIFQSFAHAQVSVTNEVYQHLGQPKFLFCPTEYCAARSVPSVSQSEYLKTVGSKLLPDIDVMWTGPKVISKKITIRSLKEVSDTLQRPPVIWDNIHANDYDQRRLFLGPYEGRSPDIIPYIHGVLTNPNCEFEANYIALHTLAQWCKSNEHAVKPDIYIENSVCSDIQLETEGEYNTDEEISYLNTLYHPRQALQTAVTDWLKEFQVASNSCFQKPPSPLVIPTPSSCMAVTPTTSSITGLSTIQSKNLNDVELNESYMQPAMNPVNSLENPSCASDSEGESSTASQEPMDCVVTPGSTPVSSHLSNIPSLSCPTSDNSDKSKISSEVMQIDSDVTSVTQDSIPSEQSQNPTQLTSATVLSEDVDLLETKTTVSDSSSSPTQEDIHLLVDLFYLPFEHGKRADQILDNFHWLKSNCNVLCDAKCRDPTQEQISAAAEWRERAQTFQNDICKICDSLDRLSSIPNQALLYDLFPYIHDMKAILSLLGVFMRWLAEGHVPYISVCYMMANPYTWANSWYRESFRSGRKEPWVFRGGLQADFQRLLPLESVTDLLMPVVPPVPCAVALCNIRPYMHTDEKKVYEICRKTCDDGCDSTDIFPDHPELPGDRYIGAFVSLSPEYCFAIEDNDDVHGYILAALNAKDLMQKQEMAWFPAMQEKYPKSDKTEDLSPAEEMICGFHVPAPPLPDALYMRYPSTLRMNLMAGCKETGVERRAMVSAVAALKANGSVGVYVEVPVGEKNTIDFYNKLGFFPVPMVEQNDDRVILGRIL